MADSLIDFRIDIDERRIVARFEQLPGTLRAALVAAITPLTAAMWSRAEAAEPRGATGELQADTKFFVDQNDNFVRGRVRVLGPGGKHNVKAAALNYGAHRLAKVRAYQRSGDVLVKAYKRRTNITGVQFLRDARGSIEAQAVAGIQQAVAQAIARGAV